MSPPEIGTLGIAAMLVLFMTKMPVAYVMTLIGFLGFSYLTSTSAGLSLLPKEIYSTFANYDLTTIPLFILMGQLVFSSGISSRLYNTAYKWLGGIRGGMAMATVSSCTAFGAVCGSSPATAATMATVGVPEMRRFGYKDALSTGSVASGGGLGMIMPPSVVLIVYGILTEQSIGQLFMAGIIPAVLVTIVFIITIWIWCILAPDQGPAGEKSSWKTRFLSLLDMGEVLLIFCLVMGGLFWGLFTPTEAAGVGVFGVLVATLVRRQLTWDKFTQAIMETLRSSCMVMVLVAGATVFGKFMAVTRIPFEIASWIGGFDLPGFVVVGMIVLVYFIGGLIMDALALVMLTIPIFYPVIQQIGYDPIWFGIIIVLVTQLGVITPPVGINVYVVYGVTRGLPGEGVRLESIFRGVMPFLLAILASIVLMTIFPDIILLLPNLLY
ncbi:MAG: TRAP transporter large permease [Desulfovermiculus sp.]